MLNNADGSTRIRAPSHAAAPPSRAASTCVGRPSPDARPSTAPAPQQIHPPSLRRARRVPRQRRLGPQMGRFSASAFAPRFKCFRRLGVPLRPMCRVPRTLRCSRWNASPLHIAEFRPRVSTRSGLLRSWMFWRMRASLGLACAQAATLCTQSANLRSSWPRAARPLRRPPVPKHHLPVLGLCLRPHWMQPFLLFSISVFFLLVRVALK